MELPAWARRLTTSTAGGPVTLYACAVVAGRQIACETVGLAAERHLRDLRDLHERSWWFDDARAEHIYAFFADWLVLPDSREPFVLLDWQKFWVGSLFGWVDEDGWRRFRESYTETGKGSGKTPTQAGVGLYGLTADDEASPCIFAGAPVLDQAELLWHDARRIVEASPHLAAQCRVHLSTSTISTADGTFAATTGDSATKDGPRVSMALIDELHEHRSPETVGKLRKGFKNRRQPLLSQTTNAGANQAGICWETRELVRAILQGQERNDRIFGYIATVDEKDKEFEDETCWPKANPSLGQSIRVDYLRQEVERSRSSPQERKLTSRLNFGRWLNSVAAAFDMDGWDAGQCADEWTEESLAGQECWIGVDLASKIDLASVTVIFKRRDPLGWRWISRSWTPELNLADLEEHLRQPLSDWVRDGHLVVCPGDRINPLLIQDQIREWNERYTVLRVGFDPWNIGALDQSLAEACGWPSEGDYAVVLEVPQTIKGLSWASKEVQAEIRGGRVDTNANPLLRWQAKNTTYWSDGNENMKPMKDDQPGRRGKMDAIVAAIIARAVCRLDEPPDEVPVDDGPGEASAWDL